MQLTMTSLVIAAFLVSTLSQSNPSPADLLQVSKGQDELVRKAIRLGETFKSEKEFWASQIEPRAKTKRNMIQATKEVYSLMDLDRISFAAAYAKARHRALSENEAKSMLIDAVQVVLKITAWGAQGVAIEARKARESTILVTSGDDRLATSQQAQWIGSITEGLPIYQLSGVSGGAGTIVVWNNIGQSFAHGTVFLSCIVPAEQVRTRNQLDVSIFRDSKKNKIASVDAAWLLKSK